MRKTVKVIRATSMGYCMGVQKAIEFAEHTLRTEKPVYSHGLIIHNKQEIQRLANLGLNVIESQNQVSEGDTILIRAHGIHPEEKRLLKSKNIQIIDATCPLVLINQKTVQKKSREGYVILIAGHKDHPEIQALVGFAQDYFIIENTEDVESIPIEEDKAYFLLSQTTLRPVVFDQIEKTVRERFPNIQVFNSICAATKERQNAIKNLLKQVDVIVIVGDNKSANSKGLVDLVRNEGKIPYLIEKPEDITDEIRNHDIIGLSAAASAPGWLIDKIEQALVSQISPNVIGLGNQNIYI